MDFGPWRALMQQPPSPRVWWQLVQGLDGVEDSAWLTQVLVPYLDGRLRHWDDHLRTVPHHWFVPQSRPRQSEVLSLCRCLMYSPSFYGSLTEVMQQEGLSQLTRLDFNTCGLKAGCGAWMVTMPCRKTVVALSLWNNHLVDEDLELMCRKHWPDLRVLNLGYNRLLTQAALDAMLRAPWITQLEQLTLRGMNITPRQQKAFLSSLPMDVSAKIIT